MKSTQENTRTGVGVKSEDPKDSCPPVLLRFSCSPHLLRSVTGAAISRCGSASRAATDCRRSGDEEHAGEYENRSGCEIKRSNGLLPSCPPAVLLLSSSP